MGFSPRKALGLLLFIAMVSAVLASEDAEGPLEFLRNHTQFVKLRDMVRENPQLLNSYLQQIAQNDPAFYEVVTQNKDEFLCLLFEEAYAPGSVGGVEGSATLPAEDRAAIERLKSLGFSESQAIQAYIECDRNEQDAANRLIQSMDEEK